MQALNLFISHGALQDSAARDPPPRCFSGTRKKEKETIRRWIEEPNPRSSLFLIQGRTGVGKTAFMQTIADQLQAENRQQYACFFFKRGVVGCNKMDQLFSTLAYQLAINIPSMREHVERAMMEDPALPMRSAATQLQKLIIIPFKLLSTPRSSLILIIDGLDECEGEESQDSLLEYPEAVRASAMRRYPRNLGTFHFLIVFFHFSGCKPYFIFLSFYSVVYSI
jgi:Cdc6-like AAA superfamily ATPase